MATNNQINVPTPFAINKGGTGVTSVTTAPTASAWAGWDANKNFSATGFIPGYSTTATAAGTTTLTVGSNQQQYFTGVTTQTLVMPVASTLVVGQYWSVINNSSGVVTIQSSGANTILALPAASETVVTCVLASGTSAASWATSPAVSGSGTVNSGLINQLAWYAASGTAVSGLATSASGVLITNGSSVPSILAAGTTGQVLQASTAGSPSWSTATYPSTAGTSGNVLTSNGTNFISSAPIGFSVISATVFSTASTNAFTPNANTVYIYYELCAGGGGGGGGDNGAQSQANAGGGASGSIAKGLITRAQAIGAGTQLQIVVGAAGSGATAGANTGGTGGTSTLIANNGAGSTIASCLGGLGGVGSTAAGLSQIYVPGGLGQAATVSVGTQIQASAGNNGGLGLNGNATGTFRGFASCGADSPYGAGGAPQITADSASNAGLGNGSGGAGAHSINSNIAGGAGTAGYCLLVEYRTA